MCANSTSDVLLNQIAGFKQSEASLSISRPFAVEASWATGKWNKMKDYMSGAAAKNASDFNIGIAAALIAFQEKNYERFTDWLVKLRKDAARSLSTTSVSSLQACHDTMLKFHVLTDIEVISRIKQKDLTRVTLVESLEHRLNVLGAFSSNKQYLLGIRRAMMQLSRLDQLAIL